MKIKDNLFHEYRFADSPRKGYDTPIEALDNTTGNKLFIDGVEKDCSFLPEFARWCALQVIHLWDAPPVVREFLETGKEELRDAARDTARAAASDAASDAARAAMAAAWAARRAAMAAAMDAAWDAARAARDAARDTAMAAARAARRAARDTAMAAAWAARAARDTAREAQNNKLLELIHRNEN